MIKNLRNLRIKAKLTQQDLSSRLGVTQAAVAMWETGKASPTVEKLTELAKILKCDINDLLGSNT